MTPVHLVTATDSSAIESCATKCVSLSNIQDSDVTPGARAPSWWAFGIQEGDVVTGAMRVMVIWLQLKNAVP